MRSTVDLPQSTSVYLRRTRQPRMLRVHKRGGGLLSVSPLCYLSAANSRVSLCPKRGLRFATSHRVRSTRAVGL